MISGDERKMLYLDIAIIAGELAGLVFSIDKHGWWGQFVYYTQWSNYILLIAAVIHLVCLLRRSVPTAAERFLYVATCLTTVTFLVTVCILIPWYGHAEWFLLETNGLFHHLLCPLLAVACLPFLHPMRKKDALLAVIPTFIYGVILYTLNYFRRVDGPYPFLKVHAQPWYMSVLWFVLLAAAAYGIAMALRLLCGRKLKADETKEGTG